MDRNEFYFLDYGESFAIVLNDDSFFLPTEYHVLQSQVNNGFLKCEKLKFNGKTQLFYLTEGFRPLTEIAATADSETMLKVIQHLLNCISFVKKNGFIRRESISASPEHIFVNSKTLEMALTYLPSSIRFYTSLPSFENALRVGLSKLLQDSHVEMSERLQQLSHDLSNQRIPFDLLLEQFAGHSFNPRTPFVTGDVPEGSTKSLTLTAINTPVPFEIRVTKDNFRIGKKADQVDGVISFNRLISRQHCVVFKCGENYAIMDLNSANGTYVNGMRLYPEQQCTLKDGDSVSFANSEFCVAIR